jgi:trk system potassium uptake protein TrkH
VDNISVENRVIFGILAFMLLYGTTIIVTAMLLLFSGLEPISAFSAIIACINNTGPGLNQVGPATTFANLTDFQTWVCTITMLLGRLELLPVLVLLTPTFWRN